MKSKKAIKELKREIAYLKDAHNAIHSFTAYQSQDIDEFKRQNQTNEELIGILNEKLNSVILRADNISKLQSEIQTIARHVQNLEAEKCSCHTNTQKTDKNATERQGDGKKEYSETIVTNEMFNEEFECKLKKNILEYHPAFMLLNGLISSYTIDDLIRAKLKSKGEQYSSNGDRYSNFKRLNNSSTKQKTVIERIENFMEKHEIWIEDYQAGDVSGTLLDLIKSCIDVLCYKLLLDIYLKFNG